MAVIVGELGFGAPSLRREMAGSGWALAGQRVEYGVQGTDGASERPQPVDSVVFFFSFPPYSHQKGARAGGIGISYIVCVGTAGSLPKRTRWQRGR